MTATLTEIEALVQHYTRNKSRDIDSSATPLAVTNKIYRSLVASFPWPEFKTTVNLSTSTTSGTEEYAWSFATSEKFLNVTSIEVGSDASDTQFLLMIPPTTERIWSEAGKAANGQPVYYSRKYISGSNVIALRPIPSYTAATIKVTGIYEPTALTEGGSTNFILTSADDALALLIAADWNIHDGFPDLVSANMSNAEILLKSIWGNEMVTREILYNLLGAYNG